MANWEKGYGDFGIDPDMATLRRIPWLDRTALVLCDVVNHDGSPVVASPRQVLIASYERAAEMGYTPQCATELEFYLYKESYAEAHEKDYTDLTPTIPYILDYHILATTMDEQYLGPIRRGMHDARASRSSSRRARPGTASTRSTSATPTRSPPPTATRSTRTASRRSPS